MFVVKLRIPLRSQPGDPLMALQALRGLLSEPRKTASSQVHRRLGLSSADTEPLHVLLLR